MSATIQDIATRLKLSPATVSRSLRQSARVKPETRAQVAAVAAELGYQGRSRRGSMGESDRLKVGMLLRSEESHASANAMLVLQGLTAESDAVGATLSVYAAQKHDLESKQDAPTIAGPIQAGECDVVVLEGHHNPCLVEKLATYCSVVSINWLYEGIAHDTVSTDNLGGIHAMVDRLAAHGHRRLAWIDEWYPSTFGVERQAAYLQRCIHHGFEIRPSDIIGHRQMQGPFAIAIESILSSIEEGCTGLVCSNDRIAALVIAALGSHGLRVPEDVSVTGFDAMPLGPFEQCEITTFNPLFIEVGRTAMALAARRNAQPGAGRLRVSIAGQAVHGTTVGPVRSRSSV